jgi:hypothetical protein
MGAQPEAGCAVAAGYETRTRVNSRWIRALLGVAFVATLLYAIGVGQPAIAQKDGQDAPQATAAPVALFTANQPIDQNAPPPARIAGEVVTTLPTTGVGPSDPDKQVTHWLFVIGGTLIGFANFWLARRKLLALKTVRVERSR